MSKKKDLVNPAVKVGQIWKDNDARRPKRTLKIVNRTVSFVEMVSSKTGKKTIAKAIRFKSTVRGYKLVRNVKD